MSNNKQLETVEEFLARGGTIQRVEPAAYDDTQTISSTQKSVLDLKTLAEADELYGDKPIKKINLSRIKRELLPKGMQAIYDEIVRNQGVVCAEKP